MLTEGKTFCMFCTSLSCVTVAFHTLQQIQSSTVLQLITAQCEGNLNHLMPNSVQCIILHVLSPSVHCTECILGYFQFKTPPSWMVVGT